MPAPSYPIDLMATTATAQAAPVRWWLPLILGILGILVGLSFLANPAVTSVGFAAVLLLLVSLGR